MSKPCRRARCSTLRVLMWCGSAASVMLVGLLTASCRGPMAYRDERGRVLWALGGGGLFIAELPKAVEPLKPGLTFGEYDNMAPWISIYFSPDPGGPIPHIIYLDAITLIAVTLTLLLYWLQRRERAYRKRA